jgi:hypothetical protein
VIHEIYGDPKMPATKAAHYTVGHIWQVNDNINFNSQLYLNKQWDIPRLIADGEAPVNGNTNWLHDEVGRMYGFELMLKYTGKKFWGWLCYTASRLERKNSRLCTGFKILFLLLFLFYGCAGVNPGGLFFRPGLFCEPGSEWNLYSLSIVIFKRFY